jgi:hypothetical protein
LQVGASTSVGTWLNVTDSASVGSWLVVGGGAWVGSTLSLGTGQQSGSLFVRGPGEVPRVLAWADGDAGVATIRRPDGQDSIFLEGRTGFVYSRSGGDWRIVGGNPARSVHSVWLFAGSGGTDVAQVDLGSTRQVFACVAMTGSDPLDPVDRLDAFAVDVFLVDGNPTASFVHGGDHWGAQGAVENVRAQSWWGRARTIQFRARSRQNASVMGLGLVFFE